MAEDLRRNVEQAEQVTQHALDWLKSNPQFLDALAKRWSDPKAKQFGPVRFSSEGAIFTAMHDSTTRHESTSTMGYQQIFSLEREASDGVDLLEIGTGANPYVRFTSTRPQENESHLENAERFLHSL